MKGFVTDIKCNQSTCDQQNTARRTRPRLKKRFCDFLVVQNRRFSLCYLVNGSRINVNQGGILRCATMSRIGVGNIVGSEASKNVNKLKKQRLKITQLEKVRFSE